MANSKGKFVKPRDVKAGDQLYYGGSWVKVTAVEKQHNPKSVPRHGPRYKITMEMNGHSFSDRWTPNQKILARQVTAGVVYTLRIMSYSGTVPWAKHYTGRVEGPHPDSCHGGTRFNGADGPLKGKITCFEGHILPEKVEWAVEAAWTERQYERYAANHFEGEGPGQYLHEHELVRDAIQRFLGMYPQQWWEEQYPLPQPGDQLYLGHLATRSGEKYSDGYGHMLAEIPAKLED